MLVAALATEEYKLLIEPKEKVANLANYSNTKFAAIILDERFYLKLKRVPSQTLQKVEKLAKEKALPLRFAFKSKHGQFTGQKVLSFSTWEHTYLDR